MNNTVIVSIFWIVGVGLFFFLVPVQIVPNKNLRNENLFIHFISKYNRTYRDNEIEYNKRFVIFQKTIKTVNHLNQDKWRGSNAHYGINEFADLTETEFTDKYLKIVKTDLNNENISETLEENYWKFDINYMNDIPTRVDWRKKGVVTTIQNHRICPSSHILSIISTLESLVAIKLNSSLPFHLSVQQLLECKPKGVSGCARHTCSSLKWLRSNQMKLFPHHFYLSSEGVRKCQNDRILANVPNIKTVTILEHTCANFTENEEKLLIFLAQNGPVIATVDASLWRYYIKGVIDYKTQKPANHAVQIVGYNLDASNPYYIVQNSWGEGFGDDGFVKIAFGRNSCGIASDISIVKIFYN